ncbi:hypothetical protein M0D44_16530 [Xanthomonas prunicola]|uniref:hypothetical protein n=1 Tax=Xanthomonas prunicola TaxID=2053930 RepID=UPI0021B4858B|nr:hypothetical protein [Xanthomonas prunicola]UXA47917.1 hypothetical protein M0D44_16530 [Xanthomonas prunicola]
MNDAVGMAKVVRKTASSGKLDYVPVVVLNETARTKLHVVWMVDSSWRPYGVFRKLEGFKKTKALP